jgi:hypothetical protein
MFGGRSGGLRLLRGGEPARPITKGELPVSNKGIPRKRISVNDVLNASPRLPTTTVKLCRATASLLCAVDEIKRASNLVSDAVDAVEEAQTEASNLDLSENADTFSAIVETLDGTIVSLALIEIDLNAIPVEDTVDDEGELTTPTEANITN